MSTKLKMLPAIFMLTAGAVTSIITYILNYEGKTALLILLGVLLLFYVMGFLFQRLIYRFEQEQEALEKARLEEEGKVVEKGAESSSGNDMEDGVKDE